MDYISSKDAKNNFGELLDKVQRTPVTIQRHNRDSAVVMSVQEYTALCQALAIAFNATCDNIAENASRRGMTDELLKQLLESMS